MPATAPRTTRPAASSARRSTRASSAAAATRRTAVPPLTIVKGPPGPAIKLGNTAAARDPRFNRVMEKLEKSSAKAKEHVPPARKAAEAQAAAQPPANEKLALAQADQVDTMKDAETKKPEPDSFLTLLRTEIEKAMPKNLGATENFMKGDDKEKLKGAATGNVNQQKEAATSGIKSASNQPPDPGQVAGKEVQPLPSEGAPPQPPAVGAADALPAAKPDDEVSLQKSKDEANKSLTDANVTPEQLQKANDPRFSAVLTSKSAVEKQAGTAPQKYRSEEQKAITQTASKAVGDEKKGLQALHGTQGKTANSVKARQLAAKAQDEAKRKEVTAHIQQIYNETKQAVDKKLSGLEKEVSDMFDKGMEAALTNMTDYIDSRMSKWKFERYLSIPGGLLLWAKDKLFGLPDEVNVFYEEGRKRFLKDLDSVIVDIAKLVDMRLKEAKDEITNGQKRISDYVNGLPKDLQSVGKAAEKEMASRFDELRQGVDDKKNELAQNLAQRYKEANDKANDKLKEMQSENKGLVSVLKEKLGEVVKILTEFKERIMGMLKQGKAAIDLIVADPIGFLKNLLNAVKQGLNQFVNNIWTHLKAGFMAWLFGSLAELGIEMPKDFSLGSILKLVLQVLGLTYPRIRAKAVKLVGERTVKILETAADFVVAFVTGGAAALWEKVKEYLGNLKEMLINAVQDWVVTSVIKAAITKLATMFNPVGAIVQAIITIYNTVMFFIERINQILDFVQAIVSSVYKIATGDISSAANWIEQALARTIPIIIGFLARLLGLSGLADKIKGFILKIQDKVDKAIDLVIQKIVSGIGKLFGKGKEKEKEPEKQTAGFKVEQTLAMSGEGHHIYASEQNGKLVVEMATDRRDLFKNIVASALTHVKEDTKRDRILKKRLNKIYAELTDLENAWYQARNMDDAKKQAEIGKRTSQIAQNLQNIGKEFGVKDLITLGHPSKYVEGNEITPKFRKQIRELFYGKKYQPSTYTWKENKILKLIHSTAPGTPKGKFKDENGDIIPRSEATIDHQPRIVEHWLQLGGNNMKQAERVTFYNGGSDDPNNKKLRIISRSKNSSDGAEARNENLTYSPIVGEKFRGPDDEE